MARHGYLREFDEDYGSDEDRERGWIDRRDTDRDWRRDELRRGFMFGGAENRHGYGREHGYGGFQGDYTGGREQGGFGGYGDYAQGRRSFSPNPDDHYRSWRDKQMQELDRDYEEYCREREQQFHQNFDSWRRGRRQSQRNSPEELLLSRPKSGMTADPVQDRSEPIDPDSAATMGQAEPQTTTSTTGRGRR
jgi:hypothetical protein